MLLSGALFVCVENEIEKEREREERDLLLRAILTNNPIKNESTAG
jgi:hypothetical protein